MAKRPARGLAKRELRDFLKRTRRTFKDQRIRYFACGEYGEHLGRPHYHAILFGTNFAADRRPWKNTPAGDTLYVSPTLDKLWGKGHALLSEVTFETAAYVARYTIKKITGNLAAKWYGELQPEFATMSLRPGIGNDWINKYKAEAMQNGTVVMRGHEMQNPRYYDNQIEKTHKAQLQK